ncbi:Ifa38 [Kluyveromyces lactis]|nr:Ifa38 [Kluyveromyces lactis]
MVALIDQLYNVTALRECSYLNVAAWIVFGLGISKVVFLTLNFSKMVLDLFVLPSPDFKKYGKGKGAYAVVTGASDGIGKEYAKQLAKRGFNLILISRTESKLVELKKEIETECKIDVKILAIDVSSDSKENYTLIREVASGLPVTVLINNVGKSHSIPVPFDQTEESELRDIITINNTATLMITQTLLPQLKASVKTLKCRGLILTMGSFGGLLPTPLLATYSGSKAFLQSWSNALAGELSSDSIDVELVLSYLVTSAMSKIRRSSALIPTPKAFVRSTLNSIGKRCGAQERFATSTPYWSHALYHFIIENTVGVYSKVANSINCSFHLSIRKRALKKAERQAKKQ